MKAVILCGGLGTRIRDAGETIPKPLLPIGGRPMLWHIMKFYAASGVRDFVLCLGYQGWAIKEFFLNYRAMTSDLVVEFGGKVEFIGETHEDWRITMAETGETTGTGGRVAAIRRYVENEEHFFLTYGDGLADVDLDATLAQHRASGKICTVTAVRPPSRFGELRIDGSTVTDFNEKPQVTEGYINGGFFVCDGRRIWDYVEGDASMAFERAPLQGMTRDRQLNAFCHDGFWQPMDTRREMTLLNELWDSGRAPWKRW